MVVASAFSVDWYSLRRAALWRFAERVLRGFFFREMLLTPLRFFWRIVPWFCRGRLRGRTPLDSDEDDAIGRALPLPLRRVFVRVGGAMSVEVASSKSSA